jgi:hypothetical protein
MHGFQPIFYGTVSNFVSLSFELSNWSKKLAAVKSTKK